MRSGKYKQGKDTLKNNDGLYCCLGVLCSITKMKNWNGENELPYHVLEKLEMKHSAGLFGVGKSRCLASLNDNGKTFEEIADIIEENWRKL